MWQNPGVAAVFLRLPLAHSPLLQGLVGMSNGKKVNL
jgi:hypothetical protein